MFEYKTHLQDDTPHLRGQPLCKRFSVLRLVATVQELNALARPLRCASCVRRCRPQGEAMNPNTRPLMISVLLVLSVRCWS